MLKILSKTTDLDVPLLTSDQEYLAALQVYEKLKLKRDEAKVEALRLKALEGFKADDPDHETRIAKLARGDAVDDSDEADYKEASRKASNTWSDLVDATELSGKHLREARYKASGRICQSLIKPKHDEIATRLVSGLAEAYSASVDLYKLKNQMMAEQIGFIGVCQLTPHTFLGATSDPSSPLALFFREANQLGFSVPKEFR